MTTPKFVGNVAYIHKQAFPALKDKADRALKDMGSNTVTAALPLPRELMQVCERGWEGSFRAPSAKLVYGATRHTLPR